jgi:hypothetical protein
MMRLSKLTHMKDIKVADATTDITGANPSVVRLLKMLMVFVAVVHFTTCLVGMLVRHELPNEAGDRSTMGISGLLRSDDDQADFLQEWGSWDASQQYSRALLWCLAALMGDVGLFGSPATPFQVGLSSVFVVFGLLWISVVTGSTASLIANMDASSREQKEKLDGIKSYLTFKKVCYAVSAATSSLLHGRL